MTAVPLIPSLVPELHLGTQLSAKFYFCFPFSPLMTALRRSSVRNPSPLNPVNFPKKFR